jgi:hypothetical protein
MSDPSVRAALTDVEVRTLLEACGRSGLLVGGQALAFWARYYDITPDGPLSEAVTTDADFIGTRELAALLHARLGPDWSLRNATLEDTGGQTSKLFVTTPYGFKEVDILSGIVGLDTGRIQARAVEVDLASGTAVRVLHPLDVLESRLRNLQVLPSKRNAAGIAQARPAIAIVRGFLSATLRAAPPGRVAFESVKRVVRLALDSALAIVALDHDLDVLSAVPDAEIPSAPFRAEAWPRALKAMERRRAQYRALQERRTRLRARPKPRSRS